MCRLRNPSSVAKQPYVSLVMPHRGLDLSSRVSVVRGTLLCCGPHKCLTTVISLGIDRVLTKPISAFFRPNNATNLIHLGLF